MAGNLIVSQDANGSSWPVSPQHPMSVSMQSTAAGQTSASAQAVQNTDGSSLATASSQPPLTVPGTAAASGLTATVVPAALAAVVAANASSLVIKASPGNLYDVYALPSAAAFLILINATSAPASGTAVTPVDIIPIAAGAQGGFNYQMAPESFSTGIVALLSSTGFSGATCTFTALAGFLHGRAK